MRQAQRYWMLMALGTWLALGQRTEAQSVSNLEGTWEATALVEDGHLLTGKAIRDTLFKDGRITIKGQTLAFQRANGEARVLLLVTNPKTIPPSFDLGGEMKLGNQGIYQLDGDSLTICLNASPMKDRPREFTSRSGQGTVLISLQRVANAPAANWIPVLPKPVILPTPPPADKLRDQLVGTWGHQDDNLVQKITFNPDGTYSQVTTYKKGLQKLFKGEDRSSGTWVVKEKDVIVRVQATTEKEKLGQVYSFTVENILPGEVIYHNNMTGQRRIEWRLH